MYVYFNGLKCLDKLEYYISKENSFESNTDILIYTGNAIYKKYKHHFYKLKIEKYNETVNYVNSVECYTQTPSETIDKMEILSQIPFEHYISKRETNKYLVTDNIILVHEIENQMTNNFYFHILNEDTNYESIIEKISLYINKIVEK